MIPYIFVVALLNMGLGFGVAMYLGRRYRAMVAAGNPWIAGTAFDQFTSGTLPTDENAVAGAETPLGEPQQPAGETGAPTTDVAPGTPTGPPAEETVQPQFPAESERERGSSEASVEGFRIETGQYHAQLTKADGGLRTYVETPDAAAIEECLGSLLKATEEYLKNRGKAYASFQELHQQRPEFGGINENLQAALERQDGQIESTNQIIEAFDYENDLKDGCRQMVGETSKLLNVNHHLRDTLDEATVEVARSEHRLGAVDPAIRNDALTGISSRAGFEAQLFEWWEKDPHRVRELSVAMIDIDQFAQVNERFGHNVGDKILRTIAKFLKSESRGESKAARLAGQRFLFLFPDADLRFTTNVVERIRQTIEMAHFYYHDSDIQVTVSCAVIEATSEDTSATLIARAETTLQEAKRYGRNRTFLHEGKYPTPVVPPNFSLQEKQITL